MKKQISLYESGNELAAMAAKQINYHVMGYYPITPSTQIAENLDLMKAQGLHDISLIAAEGEHSAAGICYGASTGGGRVFNATSANGLLYALEQLPVQSGTRFPMVMNVACRTVSGPLSIKGDHSDIMMMLNCGWIILFANSVQMVYDYNLIGLKLAEAVNLPVAVAFDGFFTSHQKRRCMIFADDQDVQDYVGPVRKRTDILDTEHPVTIGSYMNEPDLINNKYQLHEAMEQALNEIEPLFEEFEELSGRPQHQVETYRAEDAAVMIFALGSTFHTLKEAVDQLRKEGIEAGAATLTMIRPFPKAKLIEKIAHAQTLIILDRQDSYGAQGGNMSLEIRAALQEAKLDCEVYTRIYGLGGKDFYYEEAVKLVKECVGQDLPKFDYLQISEGQPVQEPEYFKPLSAGDTELGFTRCVLNEQGRPQVQGGQIAATTAMPKRLAPGHGACPGCGIPVNVNLLLRGIEGLVVLLFQTGCGMVVTTSYPKTSFKVPYLHNLFQNGAATVAGLAEMFHQRQKRGELPQGEITFIMISGDGGMDIGLGSAIGAALRNDAFILMEYDNGGYMNTGYQLSYSTPMGARSSTSHIGKTQYGKTFVNKDTPQIMAAAGAQYVATVAESQPVDFLKKAAKAQYYAKNKGFVYLKALSACPLNWADVPSQERKVIQAAVDCGYFPLYEIEEGVTTINYNPEKTGKQIPALDWLKMMGRTRHLGKPEYAEVVDHIQKEIDKRWIRLKARAESEVL